MKILFLHGWQSRPSGIKPTFLKDHGHEVLTPALPDDDFDEAVRIAQGDFDRGKPDVVVGSSRGGAVAMNINSGSTPLVLLCPAWKRWGTATTVKPGTIILHTEVDEVVPFSDSEELVRNSGLPSESLVEVGTEHRLADEESLKKMVEVVERTSSAPKPFRQRWRTPASVLLLIVGTCFLLLLDGQLFTNSLTFLTCWTASLIIRLSDPIRRTRHGLLQIRSLSMIVLHIVLIAWIILCLPHSYTFQKHFNQRTEKMRNTFNSHETSLKDHTKDAH